MLASRDPALLEQIQSEEDPQRQEGNAEKAREDHCDIIEQARERLAQKFPEL